jgi:hypothetical protein
MLSKEGETGDGACAVAWHVEPGRHGARGDDVRGWSWISRWRGDTSGGFLHSGRHKKASQSLWNSRRNWEILP